MISRRNLRGPVVVWGRTHPHRTCAGKKKEEVLSSDARKGGGKETVPRGKRGEESAAFGEERNKSQSAFWVHAVLPPGKKKKTNP